MLGHGHKWLNNVWLCKSAIVSCNALALPFALPFIAWTVVCQCYSAVLRAASSAVGGGVVLASVGMLPCMLVYSIGLAGALYCYKSMLVDGNMDVRKRFGAGIRKNGLKYLPFAFIIWLSLSLAVITPTLYSYIGAGLLYGAGIAASVIQAAVLVPAMCLAAVECAYYDETLRAALGNAFRLYFMRTFRTIGVTVLCALPIAACALTPFIAQLVLWTTYSVLGTAFGIIFWLWYGKRFFDGVIGRSEVVEQVALGADDIVAGGAADATAK